MAKIQIKIEKNTSCDPQGKRGVRAAEGQAWIRTGRYGKYQTARI